MARPQPMFQAALICDHAVQEAVTNKWTLVGIFNQINVRVGEGAEPPQQIQHPYIAVYFCIGDAEGDYPFEVQVLKIGQTQEEMIAKFGGQLHAPDRFSTTDFAVNIQGAVWPGCGRYSFRLLIDQSYVGEKTFEVRAITQGKK